MWAKSEQCVEGQAEQTSNKNFRDDIVGLTHSKEEIEK